MNMEKLFNKLLPHIVAMLLFIAVSFLFLSPMLEGKRLKQNDVRMWAGSYQETKEYAEKTHERTLWTNSMFGGMPTYQIAPYSPNSMVGTIYIYNIVATALIIPAPANALFLYCFGFYMLMLAFRVHRWVAIIGAIAYAFASFNIIIIEAGHVLQAHVQGSMPLVIAAVVYTMRQKKYLLGGALFALAFAINLRSSHIQMTYYMVILLIVYMIYEFIMAIKDKQLLNFIKGAAVLGIAATIAIGSSITLQLTSYEYGDQTIRGKSDLVKLNKSDKKEAGEKSGLDIEYAFAHSYDVGEAFCLMIPNFRGGASYVGKEAPEAVNGIEQEQLKKFAYEYSTYWGGQSFTSGPNYIGAVTMFLFVLMLLTWKSNDRWWLLAITVLAILLSMGKYFLGFNLQMYNNFPMYNKFRSVAFTLAMANIAVPLGAMLGLNYIISNRDKLDAMFRKRLFIAAGIMGGLCLIFFAVPSIAGDFQKSEKSGMSEMEFAFTRAGVPKDQIKGLVNSKDGLAVSAAITDAREGMLRADAGRSLIFILLTGGVIFLFFTGRIKDARLAIVAVGGLLFIDLFVLDKRFLKTDNFERNRSASSIVMEPTEADLFIQKDTDPEYRVLNFSEANRRDPFNEGVTSYFHKSVGGYHAAKLRRFQEMRDHTEMDGKISAVAENLEKAPADPKTNSRAFVLAQLNQAGLLTQLNMMNTKYIIIGKGESQKDVVQNPFAAGSAWFVKGLKIVNSADDEMMAINNFPVKDTAVVDIKTRPEFGKYMEGFNAKHDSAASIKLTEYRPNQVTYKSKATNEEFAVFSEAYYNSGLGWNAYLDGQKVEHVRVDYMLRGMRVPAGEHTIVYKFEPKTFAMGEKISLISSLLMLAMLIGAVAFEVIRVNKQGKKEEIKAA